MSHSSHYPLALFAAAVVSVAMLDALDAADALKSGLQPGEKITHIFEPLNINGEHAGEPYCLICENGLAPVAMLFARDLNEPLLDLLSKLDQASAKHRDQELGSFVVFLSTDDTLREKLAAVVKQRQIKHLIFSIFDPPGPEGFKVAPDANLTVVLYREHEIKANHAFRPGEFTAAASDKILADLPKILTK